ncbi:hypothetical protein BOX15_Mlig009432g1 [Macrostomum lignano]|uniref:ethanolamine-phosphate cytidylyltransferase n=2 Tax=Macrostomum lignano TaxID=282301 RepID=A0A1I8GNV3_9PLAT|nr:hypothetical protein BOX15_Mlig009432g1 [Macrostomum lignano]
MSVSLSANKENKKVRVWLDGCFDIIHFGHANAIRQAKALGDVLVVGVHSDEEIAQHKGPPVLNETERCRIVRAIKWVDEVVENVPYITSVATLDKYNCDFCAHGDDLTTSADGRDSYEEVKAVGRFKEFKRTAGVSTTDLVGRMLLATRSHHSSTLTVGEAEKATFAQMASSPNSQNSPYTKTCQFVPTTQQLVEFSTGRAPAPGEKVAYVCGSFDLFHVGHVAFLEKCYAMATYIIVGVHSDSVVNSYRGANYPIMTVFERVLSVLSCRYVANVVIDAPYCVTEELIKQFKVDLVISGSRTAVSASTDGSDPFGQAKRLGVYREVDSGTDMTAYTVIERIIANRIKFEERNRKKEQKEMTALLAKSNEANGK